MAEQPSSKVENPLQGLSNGIATTDIESPSPCDPTNTTTASVTNDTSNRLGHSSLTESATTPRKPTHPFQFGQRYLTPTSDVFTQNAWDHVSPTAAHTSYCETQYATQRQHPVSTFDLSRFNTQPQKWWDLFYRQKSSTFFKDRKWLAQEFPILDQLTREGAGPKVVLEVGAGAGNTAFPIARANRNAGLVIHAVDFSAVAVRTMMKAAEYEEGGVVRPQVWDVASHPGEGENDGLPVGVEEGSVDVVIMIFVFSALSPAQWNAAVRNVDRLLKPGGEVLFRDYGRGDLAQVRFKAGRWMQENFYVRGDGTRVYFFERDELVRIWGGEGNGEVEGKEGRDGGEVDVDEGDHSRAETEVERPRFEILNLDVDRRLIVNRQKKIQMYRCWIQGRFRKPLGSSVVADEKGRPVDVTAADSPKKTDA